MTLSNIAVHSMMEYDPEIKKTGFAKTLKKLFLETEGYKLKDIGLIPDAWKIIDNDDTQEVIAYEVEDTHPMPLLKIRKYAMLWFYLDCISFELKVIPVDRYGVEKPPLDMWTFYSYFMKEDIKYMITVDKAA